MSVGRIKTQTQPEKFILVLQKLKTVILKLNVTTHKIKSKRSVLFILDMCSISSTFLAG